MWSSISLTDITAPSSSRIRCPSGARHKLWDRYPALETPGYCQLSVRDNGAALTKRRVWKFSTGGEFHLVTSDLATQIRKMPLWEDARSSPRQALCLSARSLRLELKAGSSLRPKNGCAQDDASVVTSGQKSPLLAKAARNGGPIGARDQGQRQRAGAPAPHAGRGARGVCLL